jgi:phosphoribosyl 1,2-cyclic phosphate phosphodiesterase
MLGSGTSSGVPRIGNDWGLCNPAEPKNRRRRVSILVEAGDARLLIDTGPDVREQLLDAGVSWLTGVLYTHDHADHCHGIDDLRAVFHAMKRPVDCWMHPATRRGITGRFGYVFAGRAGYPATCVAHDLPDVLTFGELSVRWFEQTHGTIYSTGFRFDWRGQAVAYTTDCNDLGDDAFTMLHGLDLWIVDALRREPHPTHAHLSQTLGWVGRARPAAAWLTHMDQSMDFATLQNELPAGVSPGWDGRVWQAA